MVINCKLTLIGVYIFQDCIKHKTLSGYRTEPWLSWRLQCNSCPRNRISRESRYCATFARHRDKTCQQYEARAHAGKATRDFLQQNNVNVMDLPDLSQNLNHIVHLRDNVKRPLNVEHSSPTKNTAEHLLAFYRVWASIIMAYNGVHKSFAQLNAPKMCRCSNCCQLTCTLLT